MDFEHRFTQEVFVRSSDFSLKNSIGSSTLIPLTIIFITFSLMLCGSPANSSSYRDVPAGHWAADSVEYLRKTNVFPSRSTFGGKKHAMRYDVFISTHRLLEALRAYSRLDRSRTAVLDDLPPSGEPREAIIALASRGLVRGDGKNRINGLDRITRYETAVFFGRLASQLSMAEASVASNASNSPHASNSSRASNSFRDMPSNHWAAPQVRLLSSLGILRGYGDSTFRGNDQVNRYELSVILRKFADHLTGKIAVAAKNNSSRTSSNSGRRSRSGRGSTTSGSGNSSPGKSSSSSASATAASGAAASGTVASGTVATGAAGASADGSSGTSAAGGSSSKTSAKAESSKRRASDYAYKSQQKKRRTRPANVDTRGLPKASFDKLIMAIGETMTGAQAYEYGKWDCSRYVQHVMNQVNIKLPRTSAEQASQGIRATLETLVPGDLVFFDFRKGVSKPSQATHVGIFLGARGRIQFAFTHNSTSAGKVVIANLSMPDFLTRLLAVRRVGDFGKY
ncbi:MAG: hypothetical protein CVV64_20605 [Candidatus Wallbacteria bacterium HGW-Wallbacteria-1]|jgi:cell wall-associated NlpC family hydrolase|uniref:SLH domain-containing protein n=1 Tax=Candidatus Wallbacteria bacterium HGW-Wallbacteria-1 TaxID=2013854 RepID=A0A2N1PI59_9BACT|nr:MAG: hypothetical protein CVV64_20605 [Candidatus Wallbacteria bacterium HGW-Wallbacteria-1]